MARVLVFTRYGKTPEDVTRGLRSEYKIVSVKPTGVVKSGLHEYQVAVTEHDSKSASVERVIRSGQQAEDKRKASLRRMGFEQ